MYSDGAEQLLKETGQRKRAGSSTPSGPPPKKKAHKTATSTSRRKSRSISQSPRKATKKASPTKKCTPGPVKKHAKSSAKSHIRKGRQVQLLYLHLRMSPRLSLIINDLHDLQAKSQPHMYRYVMRHNCVPISPISI